MLPQYTKKANIKIGVGFVLMVGSVIGLAASSDRYEGPNSIATACLVPVILIGYALFIWGCCDYCLAKGYSWALGLIGMAGLVGLIVMAVLPDKTNQPVAYYPPGYPPYGFPPSGQPPYGYAPPGYVPTGQPMAVLPANPASSGATPPPLPPQG